MSVRVLPRTVRGRAVLASGIAVAVFGALLGLASFLLVSQSETSSVVAAMEARVSEVYDQLGDRSSADPSQVDLEALTGVEATYLQVVGTDGTVLSSSPEIPPGTSICPDPLPTERTEDAVALTLSGSSGTFLRVTSPIVGAATPSVICAVTSDGPVQKVQRAVLIGLLVVLPLLVLVASVVVWLAVGRALRAVDDLRSQADAMQSTSDGLLRVPGTEDEVERLGRTLNALLGRLHQQTRATRQFVADAGHELRNPLSTLRVTLEFGRDAEPDDLRASVDEAISDLDRLENLTEDLLVLARSDAMEQPLQFETLDLDTIVLDAVSSARRAHPDLDVVSSLQPCRVRGDERALHSIIANLLDNAARHATARVSTTLVVSGDEALLAVDDDGAGLAPDDCLRVFERFVRLDDARNRDEGGSGLGLAIVVSMAAAHGGRASAEPGPGGHFLVVLPLADPRRTAGSVARPRSS
ncbi:MAG: HAMP domain-containing protein [Actinomycetales bacterium]|nr:HAMP domain-containing protein [Actinomycetales bacterium]